MCENRSSGFPTRTDTNRAAQPQKIAKDLNFRIEEKERLYYTCSENKGAEQLSGYHEADLRLCFSICKMWLISPLLTAIFSVKTRGPMVL